jgi:hypothetical protein
VDCLASEGSGSQQLFGMRLEGPACLGNYQPAAGASEEFDAEGFFQGSNSCTDRRLADSQSFRGAMKTSKGRNR